MITFNFDQTSVDGGEIFSNLNIYDSMKRNQRGSSTKICNNSAAGKLLMKFQEFLLLYVMWGSENGYLLMANYKYI